MVKWQVSYFADKSLKEKIKGRALGKPRCQSRGQFFFEGPGKSWNLQHISTAAVTSQGQPALYGEAIFTPLAVNVSFVCLASLT